VADPKKGYLLIRVSRVDNLLASDETEKNTAKGELNTALASEYVSAYVKSLRDKGSVSINPQALGAATSN
jgi:peptidyl-prolyl cis-trans isomerase D